VRRSARWITTGLAALLAMLSPAASSPSPVQAAPTAATCVLQRGFAELAEVIPDLVGECTGNEQHTVNGDGVQVTTGGLLVWRKSDNWTAFTDGFNTWINGPGGVVERPNDQRFEWESDWGLFQQPLLVGQTWVQAEMEMTLRQVEVDVVGRQPTVTLIYTVANLSNERKTFTIDHENAVQVVDNLDRRYPLECCVTLPRQPVTLEPGESTNRFANYQGDASIGQVFSLTVTFVRVGNITYAQWLVPIDRSIIPGL
jgi:hypothetical protein